MQDYRASSYAKITKKKKSSGGAGSRFETGAESTGYASSGVSQIKQGSKSGSGSIIYSGGGSTGGTTQLAEGSVVSGGGQVAIKGGASVKTTSERVGARTIAEQQKQAAIPRPDTQQTPPQLNRLDIPISPGVASKLQGGRMVNPRGEYYVTYRRPEPLEFQKELARQPLLESFQIGRQIEAERSVQRNRPWYEKAGEFSIGFVELPARATYGSFTLLSSETRNSPAPFFPIPDLTLRRTRARAELLAGDENVQVAVAGGAFIAAGGIPVVGPTLRFGSLALGGYEAYSGYQTADYRRSGRGAFLFASAQPIKAIQRPFIEIVGRPEPIETYIGGGKVTASSSQESLRMFEAGRTSEGTIKTVHVSEAILSGQTRAGPKGAAGIEDPGLFVGPFSRANLQFAGLEQGAYSRPSLFPKLLPGQASISTIEVGNVRYLPRSVLVEPGFGGPKRQAFIADFGGVNDAFITKRSMLGFGEIPRQRFSPVSNYRSASLTRLTGRTYLEAGTSEAEAVINPGKVLYRVDSGFRDRFSYTIYNQKNVPFTNIKIPFTGDLLRTPKYSIIGNRGGVGRVSFETPRETIGEFYTRQQRISSDYISSKRPVFKSVSFGGSKNEASRMVSSFGSISSSIRTSSRSSAGRSVASSPISARSSVRFGGSSPISSVAVRSGSFSSGRLGSTSPAKSYFMSVSYKPPVSLVPPSAPPSYPIFRLKAGFDGLKIGSYGARRITQYTPSLSALFYGIRGSYKPGRLGKSGLDFRPITTSFKISTIKPIKNGVRLAL